MGIIQGNKDESEIQLADKIRQGDEDAFEELFFEYFYELSSFALQMTRSRQQAEDIVQKVFEKLWKSRSKLRIKKSLQAYLYKSVRNSALNKMEKNKRRKNIREKFSELNIKHTGKLETSEKDEGCDLVNQIWEIVLEMPERRQSVFTLHRRHGLSYNEIAGVLDISRKTVENHMGLALKDIRAQIGDTNP